MSVSTTSHIHVFETTQKLNLGPTKDPGINSAITGGLPIANPVLTIDATFGAPRSGHTAASSALSRVLYYGGSNRIVAGVPMNEVVAWDVPTGQRSQNALSLQGNTGY